MATSDAIAALQQQFSELGFEAKSLMTYLDGRDSGQHYVRVEPENLLAVMEFLKTDDACQFDMLSDVTAIDYLNYPDADDRFAVIYMLVSTKLNHRLWVKVFVNDPDPTVPSVTHLWNGANWREREQYDMFGITFEGHPDLRRILCAEFFEDHPLRKDYPLHGKGERENFPRLTRT